MVGPAAVPEGPLATRSGLVGLDHGCLLFCPALAGITTVVVWLTVSIPLPSINSAEAGRTVPYARSASSWTVTRTRPETGGRFTQVYTCPLMLVGCQPWTLMTVTCGGSVRVSTLVVMTS